MVYTNTFKNKHRLVNIGRTGQLDAENQMRFLFVTEKKVTPLLTLNNRMWKFKFQNTLYVNCVYYMNQ